MTQVAAKRNIAITFFLITIACTLGYFGVRGLFGFLALSVLITHIRSAAYQALAILAVSLLAFADYFWAGPMGPTVALPPAVYVFCWLLLVAILIGVNLRFHRRKSNANNA